MGDETLNGALLGLGLRARPAVMYRHDIVGDDGTLVAEALDVAQAWTFVRRARGPAQYEHAPTARSYRVTGLDLRGLVSAEYWSQRAGEWRLVKYEHRLAILTVAHTGSLPPGYPDSWTRAKVLPKLRRSAAAYVRHGVEVGDAR